MGGVFLLLLLQTVVGLSGLKKEKMTLEFGGSSRRRDTYNLGWLVVYKRDDCGFFERRTQVVLFQLPR